MLEDYVFLHDSLITEEEVKVNYISSPWMVDDHIAKGFFYGGVQK